MTPMNAERWAKIKPIFSEATQRPADQRAAFIRSRCGGDEALVSEIESLLVAHDKAGSFIEGLADSTAAAALEDRDRMIGRLVGAYELVRELGRGGMGSVYLATRADDEFRKLVAVKLINAEVNNKSIIRRFRNERQILAALDHPNIARLLDGGTTEDGTPYFVMEYVDGKPIRDYCDAHRLSTEERLRLFRHVCSAVHYSHQNLVIHRDLKPSNILVTEDGTPKLLDFGIAKLIGASASLGEASLATSRVMTPEYASPEQVRGESITTASDVYSLGVMLYELLSGHRPYRVATTSPLEMIQAICEQEPEKPSTAVGRTEKTSTSDGKAEITPETVSKARDSQPDRLRRRLKGDLDNVVLKAMRKEPRRRYSSAEQFSDDLRRHLEGLPVIARKDTFSYRAGKFVRRNRLGVSAAAIIMLLLVSGVIGIARQTVIANRQRASAENRFNQVRKLANLVVFDYQDNIEKLPGSTPVREKMIKDAIEYLDALSVEGRDDATLQQELASAYEKIGDVQGNPYFANLGDRPGALESYRKALAIRERLHEANPADESGRHQLGNAYKSIGDILWGTSANRDSLENYQKSLAVYTELSSASPENPKYRYRMAASLNGIGHAQEQMGDTRAALDSYRQMLANNEAAMLSEPSNVEYRRDVGIAKFKVGDCLKDLGDYQASLSFYQESEAVLSELASDKNNARASRDLALIHLRLAGEYGKLNQLEKAVEFHQTAIALQSRISSADPQNVQARFDLAASYANLGDVFRRLKKLTDAATTERAAISIFEEGLGKDPAQSQPRRHLGVAYETLGQIFFAQGNLRAALETGQKALSILEAETIRRSSARYVADCYLDLGNVYSAMQNWEAARDSYEKSLGAWRELEQRQELNGEDKSLQNEVVQKLEKCGRQMRKGKF